MNVFEKYESEVRSYCRSFPKEFNKAKGSILMDVDGNKYIDFFNGAGALNYGNNNDEIKSKLIDYLEGDNIIHALDMYTSAKREFIDTFENKVLLPRNLNYKIQFPGPTGTNGIEAALKLARKVKNRSNIFALMGCFHGMTLGALALTSDLGSRNGAGIDLGNVTHIPAPYMMGGFDTIGYMRTILTDDHSGIELPAAVILETVQAEGGVYPFDVEFLKELRSFCDEFDILLIIDDIQVGCARTGTFFSFERANITPDMVVLSKSIGGYGLPFALTLFKPELDIWKPGEHNGTFRGNQLAMVAAKAGLEFMLSHNIEEKVQHDALIIKDELKEISDIYEVRGIGLIWGIDVHDELKASTIVKKCFEKGLVLEKAGRNNSVVKIMPALTIDEDLLREGLTILKNAIEEVK